MSPPPSFFFFSFSYEICHFFFNSHVLKGPKGPENKTPKLNKRKEARKPAKRNENKHDRMTNSPKTPPKQRSKNTKQRTPHLKETTTGENRATRKHPETMSDVSPLSKIPSQTRQFNSYSIINHNHSIQFNLKT